MKLNVVFCLSHCINETQSCMFSEKVRVELHFRDLFEEERTTTG